MSMLIWPLALRCSQIRCFRASALLSTLRVMGCPHNYCRASGMIFRRSPPLSWILSQAIGYIPEARLISGIQNEVQDGDKEFFEIRNQIKIRMRRRPCKLVVREFAECTPVLLPDVPCSPRSSRQILAR